MAVTENLYTGNGSTTNYSFTFPYLATTDIKVSLNSVITTAYTFANATTVQFNTAPANGVAIRIYRDTDDSNLNATFYSGSAIRAQDLNDNFTQNLYVTQEAVNTADSATTTAASALSTANTALSNSTAAVSTANTAASDAATAVSTANTASANATTAVSTANAATTTANTALSNSTTAISTANTASSNATAAVNTANSAASDASTALSLVNNVIDYQIILDVASIPGSPVDGDRIEVVDSTGIESFTPLSGIPGGFTGAAGLSVRMSYDGTGSTWVWYDYSPSDPDSRYILDSTGTVTSTNILNGTIVDGDINASAAIAYSKLALTGTIVDADVSASAEIAVSKLADGAARQLLQTDAAGTGVEWTDNVDIPGTLDVVGAATFDSSATIVGDLTVDTNTLYVDSTNNRVGVGTTSPSRQLQVQNLAGSAIASLISTTSGNCYLFLGDTASDSPGRIGYLNSEDALTFWSNAGERGRFDSSGRLLVGTSSNYGLTTNAVFAGSASKGVVSIINDGDTFINTNDLLGAVDFGAHESGGTAYIGARIQAEADSVWTGGSPGRLVFSTTSSGNSSPDPRMTIKEDGDILFEKSSNSSTSRGFEYRTGAENLVLITNSNSVTASPLIRLNRQSSDGDLVSLRHADIQEGLISVNGTTVTYGGGHLARWSQLPNNGDPSSILKGTVMSNLDEMCKWDEEDNEQLNKTKISDVEGDKNVAGVFVSTSFSEDGPLDFFVGMTGDMVIRIAQGVTVERGDLLMSAGDGTAKPQDDDIIRSKTIAKVTSTSVTCTYDDGSYCVPCVLMAC